MALTGCASVITEAATKPDVFRMTEVCQALGGAVKAPVVRLYGGAKVDGVQSGQSLASDGMRGFILGGLTQGLGSHAGNTDLLLARIASSGQIEWVQAFGGPQTDMANAFLRTADGGYLQAGDSYGHLHTAMAYVVAGADMYRPLLVKTGTDGQYQWHKLYWTEVAGDPRGSNLYSVLQSADGGYLFTGSTAMNPIVSGGPKGMRWSDVLLARVDAEGNPLWARNYGAAGPDEAYASTHASDRGYVLAGAYSVSGDRSAADVLLLKVDPDGRLEWAKAFGGSGSSYAKSVVGTRDGGYAFVAHTDAFGAGADDILLMKTDASGNAQWSRTIGGDKDDEPTMLVETSDGGFLVTGSTASFGDKKLDALILKTDEQGNLRWARAFGEAGADTAQSAMEAPDGTITVAGWTESYGAAKQDIFLMHIRDPDALGNCLRSIDPAQSTPALRTSAPPLATGNVELLYQSDSLRKQRAASFN